MCFIVIALRHARAQLIICRSCCSGHHSAPYNHRPHVSALVSRRSISSSGPRARRPVLVLLDVSTISVRTRLLPPSASACSHRRDRHSSRWPVRVSHNQFVYHLVLILVQFDVYGCRYVIHILLFFYSVLTLLGRMTSMRGLVAYPMVLFYGSFGIMAIFSSRGTGQLAKATNAA